MIRSTKVEPNTMEEEEAVGKKGKYLTKVLNL